MKVTSIVSLAPLGADVAQTLGNHCLAVCLRVDFNGSTPAITPWSLQCPTPPLKPE
jgi:hypothetical protein